MNQSISEFYKDQKIFITGATGFLGKVLLEKILRTCPVDSIYLLVRTKKEICASERLNEILDVPLFDTLKRTQPDKCKKVKIIDGDISQPHLGISKSDRIFLTEQINIVFHSAATIRFTENLKHAVSLNTVATKTILEMCQEMKQLQSFVYVSTAYSHSYRTQVDETVYKITPGPEDVMRIVEVLPQNVIDVFESNVLMTHPNTYSYTKALAENVVLDYTNKLPIAIVRPSIVTSTWQDPTPGWIEGYSGATAVAYACGSGMVNSMPCNNKAVIDLIPVDIVINTLITAAWHTVAYRAEAIRVYNCVSGSSNKLIYQSFGLLLEKWWREYPSKYTMWYPRFVFRSSELIHKLCHVWYHIIPAAIMDLWMICIRQKPVILKRTKKSCTVLDTLTFFTTHSWNFGTSTAKSLAEHVKETTDGHLFPMDVRETSGFHWDDYMKNYILGIRRYVLKDDLDSLPVAKAKLKRLYWLRKLFHVTVLLVAASFSRKALLLFYQYIY